jgi:hypothetical protein
MNLTNYLINVLFPIPELPITDINLFLLLINFNISCKSFGLGIKFSTRLGINLQKYGLYVKSRNLPSFTIFKLYRHDF